jgi:hypothetical protein
VLGESLGPRSWLSWDTVGRSTSRSRGSRAERSGWMMPPVGDGAGGCDQTYGDLLAHASNECGCHGSVGEFSCLSLASPLHLGSQQLIDSCSLRRAQTKKRVEGADLRGSIVANLLPGDGSNLGFMENSLIRRADANPQGSVITRPRLPGPAVIVLWIPIPSRRGACRALPSRNDTRRVHRTGRQHNRAIRRMKSTKPRAHHTGHGAALRLAILHRGFAYNASRWTQSACAHPRASAYSRTSAHHPSPVRIAHAMTIHLRFGKAPSSIFA